MLPLLPASLAILFVIQQINNAAVLEASFASELEGDFHQNAIQLHTVPGAGAHLERILSWFVTGLLEVGLLSCLCQEGMSSLPCCEAAPYVSNQRPLVVIVPLGATAANPIFKWELALGEIKNLHAAN